MWFLSTTEYTCIWFLKGIARVAPDQVKSQRELLVLRYLDLLQFQVSRYLRIHPVETHQWFPK